MFDRSQKGICHPPGNLLPHQLVLSVIHTAVSSLRPAAEASIVATCVPLRSSGPVASDGQMQAWVVAVSSVSSAEGESHCLWGEPLSCSVAPPLGFDFLLAC